MHHRALYLVFALPYYMSQTQMPAIVKHIPRQRYKVDRPTVVSAFRSTNRGCLSPLVDLHRSKWTTMPEKVPGRGNRRG